MMAGLVLSMLLVPVGVAYAVAAGLPYRLDPMYLISLTVSHQKEAGL